MDNNTNTNTGEPQTGLPKRLERIVIAVSDRHEPPRQDGPQANDEKNN